MDFDIGRFVDTVQGVLSDQNAIPTEPRPYERDEVGRLIQQHGISEEMVGVFEAALAHRCGVRHAIAVSSGTAALHLAMLACGARPWTRVLVPATGFVAAANAVRYCRATPTFYGSPAQAIESLRGGVPDIAVGIDLWGHPGGMAALEALCREADIPLIEDASQALGSTEAGRPCGSFGMAATLSFNCNKIVTTGGGGAVLTNDDDVAAGVQHLATQARDRVAEPYGFWHDRVGYNYRINPLGAALGYVQLRPLNQRVDERRGLASAYREAFATMAAVEFGGEPPGCRANYWMPTCRVPAESLRDTLVAMAASGVGGRRAFTPLCDLPPYRDAPQVGPMDEARRTFATTILLPIRRTA